LNVNNVPAEDVQNLLAVLGYGLPQGSSLQGGTIQANLDLHGPFERLVTSGPVKLTNVKLAGFSLAGELARALGTANAATGNDTLVQVASSDLRYTPTGLEADHLNIIIPILGTLTGSGTVGADNALNFRLVAKLAGSSPLAQLIRLPILSQGNGGLPLRIEGTTAHPKVVPDFSGGAVGSAVGSVIQKFAGPNQKQQSGGIGGILGGIFGKKKTQQQQQPHL
jgi:AsmA protein